MSPSSVFAAGVTPKIPDELSHRHQTQAKNSRAVSRDKSSRYPMAKTS